MALRDDREAAARDKLASLVGRTEDRRQAAERAERAARELQRDEEHKARELRLLRSMSVWAAFDWKLAVMVLGTLSAFSVPIASIKLGGLALLIIPGVLGVVGAVTYSGQRWARHRLRREYEWAARSRISGYPELLAVEPGEDIKFVVDLELSGAPPSDLVEIMRGVELEPTEDERVFCGACPISMIAIKGSAYRTKDRNTAVRERVRALDRDLFEPLRTAYGLKEVRLSLE